MVWRFFGVEGSRKVAQMRVFKELRTPNDVGEGG